MVEKYRWVLSLGFFLFSFSWWCSYACPTGSCAKSGYIPHFVSKYLTNIVCVFGVLHFFSSLTLFKIAMLMPDEIEQFHSYSVQHQF